jgi:hypothetical protein
MACCTGAFLFRRSHSNGNGALAFGRRRSSMLLLFASEWTLHTRLHDVRRSSSSGTRCGSAAKETFELIQARIAGGMLLNNHSGRRMYVVMPRRTCRQGPQFEHAPAVVIGAQLVARVVVARIDSTCTFPVMQRCA